MPIIDILIAVAILTSVIIGILRGFVKEAISMATLLIAIWAALFIGPGVGVISESWIQSQDLQMWFGRVLVFAVIISLGSLLGWGISKVVRMSFLGGADKILGSGFGVVRGILLVALLIIGGQFAEIDNERWWRQSKLIPHLEVVADWIKVMAPKGLELLSPEETLEGLEIELPTDEFIEGI